MRDQTDQTADLPTELRRRANAHLGDLCHGDAVCMQSAADEIEQLRDLVSKFVTLIISGPVQNLDD